MCERGAECPMARPTTQEVAGGGPEEDRLDGANARVPQREGSFSNNSSMIDVFTHRLTSSHIVSVFTAEGIMLR